MDNLLGKRELCTEAIYCPVLRSIVTNRSKQHDEESVMNIRLGLSKIRGFNLSTRFGRYRTLLDMASYNQKQLEYASSKFFRKLCCAIERTKNPTKDHLLKNWVRLYGSTVFALFYRHN